MTTAIIITFCCLLLISYLFDISFSKTKIPSVVLLLLLGWFAKQLTIFFNIKLPDFSAILPIFGTIGLILIVLEGSLGLELDRSKFQIIKKSFIGTLLATVGAAFILALLFYHYGNCSFKDSLINAIPFCIISSAIAIPSARNLNPFNKDFVIYESSLSDILGVLFFNFIALNDDFGLYSFGHFGLQIVIITVISFIGTIGLAYLLSKTGHHIKFIPIILLIILIYEVSKVYHLPALVFILLFGLSIGNLDKFKRFKWIEKFKPDELNKEVDKFHELTAEAAFLIRALFFLLFGYLMETANILNTKTLVWSIGITIILFGFRALQLKLSKLPLNPLFYVAPRGLITILLFLSIELHQNISLVNKSLITQVIILSALIMMFGLMRSRKPEQPKKQKSVSSEPEEEEEPSSSYIQQDHNQV